MSSSAPVPDDQVRRFAHFGTFDVENYGDLLFPLVLERRLARPGCEWVHVSPVGGEPVWGDCVSTISTEEAMGQSFDGIVIGGGHIIHGQASDVAPYVSSGDAGVFAYADLWLGATLLASDLGVPIVWNAPGVPGPFAPETGVLARWAASEADYLAVRDHQSRRFLQMSGFDGDVEVALDTALEVDRLWSRAELDLASEEAFSSRRSTMTVARARRSIAVHFTSRYLQDGIEETARRLDALCRTHESTAILLALGPCHGDAKLQAEIGGAMRTSPLIIDRPQSLREIAACIRDSVFYLGSSLHGAITASAFGRPAIMVAREVEGGHEKFTGFLEARHRVEDPEPHQILRFVESWKEGLAVAEALPNMPDQSSKLLSESSASLASISSHWTRLEASLVRDSIQTRDAKTKATGRENLEDLLDEVSTRPRAYRGILLDQARSAGRFREASQKNARRFRELDRLYRDLKNR